MKIHPGALKQSLLGPLALLSAASPILAAPLPYGESTFLPSSPLADSRLPSSHDANLAAQEIVAVVAAVAAAAAAAEAATLQETTHEHISSSSPSPFTTKTTTTNTATNGHVPAADLDEAQLLLSEVLKVWDHHLLRRDGAEASREAAGALEALIARHAHSPAVAHRLDVSEPKVHFANVLPHRLDAGVPPASPVSLSGSRGPGRGRVDADMEES